MSSILVQVWSITVIIWGPNLHPDIQQPINDNHLWVWSITSSDPFRGVRSRLRPSICPHTTIILKSPSFYDVCVCLGFWNLRCAPLCGYRTTLCTTDLRCAPPTCVVHHVAQGGPMSFRSRGRFIHNVALYWLGDSQDEFACSCTTLHNMLLSVSVCVCLWVLSRLTRLMYGPKILYGGVELLYNYYVILQGRVTVSGVICPFLCASFKLKRVNNEKIWLLPHIPSSHMEQ